jgi:hypothetical protein
MTPLAPAKKIRMRQVPLQSMNETFTKTLTDLPRKYHGTFMVLTRWLETIGT